ncbi:acyl-CoA thioesterase II [Mycolicibacterium iranicum]|uniref:Acyl-CoA thioesterase II n=1 Tax=Mycolicibacterium iranicum TaxID=912594 RepID=A0A839Q2N3_MYCIR|nr:acyl-CoA thioesterase domain-containing protein [Mycolicibacterium iranicum]MBB2989184.1 acyl-CoA thioesterase II [Mycolicibacterium iranicum]
MSSSLGDVLASLQLESDSTHSSSTQASEQASGRSSFVGAQLPAPANHILGGHISAQALLAASLTARGRTPHSVHTYFLRPGDAREPVTFEVVPLQEGRTFSARRVTARQGDEILLEAMSSFKERNPGAEPVTYQPPIPEVAPPESLPEVAPHFAESDDTTPGQWASLRWFERRIVDALTAPPALSRIWWRPDGSVPDDPVLTASLVAYLSAVTLTEPAFAARGGVRVSAQRDHSVWFHSAADLSDWLLYEQSSPSSADTLAMASGTMFNRNGNLVCTVRQEMYFPPR